MKITSEPRVDIDKFVAAKRALSIEAFIMLLYYHAEAWDTMSDFLKKTERTEDELNKELEEAGYIYKEPDDWIDEGWAYELVPAQRFYWY